MCCIGWCKLFFVVGSTIIRSSSDFTGQRSWPRKRRNSLSTSWIVAVRFLFVDRYISPFEYRDLRIACLQSRLWCASIGSSMVDWIDIKGIAQEPVWSRMVVSDVFDWDMFDLSVFTAYSERVMSRFVSLVSVNGDDSTREPCLIRISTRYLKGPYRWLSRPIGLYQERNSRIDSRCNHWLIIIKSHDALNHSTRIVLVCLNELFLRKTRDTQFILGIESLAKTTILRRRRALLHQVSLQ